MIRYCLYGSSWCSIWVIVLAYHKVEFFFIIYDAFFWLCWCFKVNLYLFLSVENFLVMFLWSWKKAVIISLFVENEKNEWIRKWSVLWKLFRRATRRFFNSFFIWLCWYSYKSIVQSSSDKRIKSCPPFKSI